MRTDRPAIPSVRVATMALLALFISSQAAAEICIDVDVRFKEREPPPALVESMKKEATSIWASYEVRFEWAGATSLRRCAWAQASFDVLTDHRHPPPARSSKTILGSTSLTRRAIDHPIYIDREATEEMLKSLGADRLARVLGHHTAGPADVGRALGRVLAHEVGHVILDARDHQPRGLMRPTFLADDLVRPGRGTYTLSADEVTRLRQRELDLSAIASVPVPSNHSSTENSRGGGARCRDASSRWQTFIEARVCPPSLELECCIPRSRRAAALRHWREVRS